MKIIDLLNKIANGEEVNFRVIDDIEYYCKSNEFLHNEYGNEVEWLIDSSWLNKEVEIIEEEKKIPEKLNTWYGIEPVNLDSPTTFKDNSKYIDFNTEMFFDKINEIIDYLKSKGE